MKEKRKHIRQSDKAGAHVSVLIESESYFRSTEAELVNYSAGGLQLRMDDGGVRVGMMVIVKAMEGRPLPEDGFSGKVVWVLESDGKTKLGVEYDGPIDLIPPFFP